MRQRDATASILPCGQLLKRCQVMHRMRPRAAAHVCSRLQTGANRRPFRAAENPAQIGRIQLNATHARWFAVRHAGDGRGDRRRRATGAAIGAAAQARRTHAAASAISVNLTSMGRYAADSNADGSKGWILLAFAPCIILCATLTCCCANADLPTVTVTLKRKKQCNDHSQFKKESV